MNSDDLSGEVGKGVQPPDGTTELADAMAEKLWQAFDMLTDGPDDSDVALAQSWVEEAMQLARQYRSARSGPPNRSEPNDPKHSIEGGAKP